MTKIVMTRFNIDEEGGKFYLYDTHTCMPVYAEHFNMEGHQTDDDDILLFDTFYEALDWAEKNENFKN